MGNYLVRRLIGTLPVLMLISLLVFLLIQAAPGDPTLMLLGEEEWKRGEVVLKDREMLVARLSAVLPGVAKLRLAYREVTTEAAHVDERVELVKKVFRGEIVKGEDHGEQPV